MIGGAAALAIIAALWFRLDSVSDSLARTKADKRAALEANLTLRDTITMYQARMDVLDEINTRLLDRNSAIERQVDEQRRAVEDLADEDEAVADILSQPLPAELGRLLFSPPPGSGDTNGASEGADPEQPAD